MNEGEGFNLFKSARGINKPQTVPKYNVPNQGNHQTQGGMKTAPTMPQTTTPMMKPLGGMTSHPTKVQTNNADKTSQAVTRQIKTNYGVSTGIGSGNNKKGINTMMAKSGFGTPANNSYQNIYEKSAGALSGKLSNVFDKAKSIFSDDSHVGKGLTPQMLFQDMKVGKAQEITQCGGCNGKKGILITGEKKK